MLQGVLAYTTLALTYFGETGLPSHLDEVPLEPCLAAIEWMHERLAATDGRLVLIGGSKGAELALLLASLEPRVRGVIAYAPSHVVFQGILEDFWPARSSWVHEGEALPFVPYKYGPHFDPFAAKPDLLALYRESLTQEPLVEQAVISVENINGPVLLFSGEQDQLWPATAMAEQIVERLEHHEHPHLFRHHAYAEAGHVIHPQAGEWSEVLGGTAEANREARRCRSCSRASIRRRTPSPYVSLQCDKTLIGPTITQLLRPRRGRAEGSMSAPQASRPCLPAAARAWADSQVSRSSHPHAPVEACLDEEVRLVPRDAAF